MLFLSTAAMANSPNTIISNNVGDGTIVMEDDIMFLDSGNSLDLITLIKILDDHGNLVQTIPGCNKGSCQIDLSNFSSGNYLVQVIITGGNIFSGNIIIN